MLTEMKKIIQKLDKKLTALFLTITLIEVFAYYFLSPKFFNINLRSNSLLNDYLDKDLQSYLYWLVSETILILFAGTILVKSIYKLKFKDFGFKAGNWQYGLKACLYAILLFFIPIIFLTKLNILNPENFGFGIKVAGTGEVILFVLGLTVYTFFWEFLWRGLFLFGLKIEFGVNAVIIQTMPFVFIHFGKPFMESLFAIPGALILGLIAYKTDSFYYGFLIHILLLLLMNFFI